MMEKFLLILWDFIYFILAIYGYLSFKHKKGSPVGIVAAACIGILYWVFYL